MRLAEVLSKAPDSSSYQVESFLGHRPPAWGKHKSIEVGRVLRNYDCSNCGDLRTFASGEQLSCLRTGNNSVSIDTVLKCVGCEAVAEAWFLVRSDDLLAPSPSVFVDRYAENSHGFGALSDSWAKRIDDLFSRAQTAYHDKLGAGSMIYLRKIFEMVTHQAAVSVEISLKRGGSRKSFRSLLKEVDERVSIIPPEFSSDGYKLFSELSEVIHGDSDEQEALNKCQPCRRLVLGVVNNIQQNQEMAEAIELLGWNKATELFVVDREVS